MILAHVDRKDLGNLLYFCKTWYPIVKHIYFETVTWRTKHKIEWLRKQLAAINENDSSDLQIFKEFPMTKRLNIHLGANGLSLDRDERYASPGTLFTEREFFYLLSLFPNLKCLDLTNSRHRVDLLKILCYGETDRPLPSLEEIVTEKYNVDANPVNYDLFALKFGSCHRFRHSIKSMTTVITDIAIGNSFIEALSQFESLSTLDIYNDSLPDDTLFHVLQACPSVSNLTYFSCFDIPKKTTQQLKKLIRKLKKQGLTISQYFKNLKILKLAIPWLTAPYIDFLTEHRPQSIDDIDIHFTESSIDGWSKFAPLDVALNLYKSLQNLTNIRFRFDAFKMFDQEEVILHEDIDLFYQILHAFTGDREFHTRSATHNNGEPAVIQITGSQLYYNHSFEVEHYVRHINANDAGLSALSLKQLSKVNNLQIRTSYDPFDAEISRCYFDYAKKYFSNISCFQYLSDFSHSLEAKSLSHDRSLQNMTHISLDDFVYPPDMLYNLPEYFPRMEVLSFSLCSFLGCDSPSVTFKLSHFERLHTFDLGVNSISDLLDTTILFHHTNVIKHTTKHYSLHIRAAGGDGQGFVTGVPFNTTVEEIKRDNADCVQVFIEGADQLELINLKYFNTTWVAFEQSLNM